MMLSEVLENLNNNVSMAEVAFMAGIDPKDLERKLSNAAVELDKEDKRYNYKGVARKESLGREVHKRIAVLSIDAPFVKRKASSPKVQKNKDYIDMKYIMFKDYHEVDHDQLVEKKTFFLKKEMYHTIKLLSKENSYKISELLNILLEKGLEYYMIDIKK